MEDGAMTVSALIRRAAEAGVEMSVGRGGRLLLRAEHQPPADLLADLAAHKSALLIELEAANDHQRNAWLNLLVLADGRVIQHCSDLAAADVEQSARQRYGNLLAVVGVPGYRCPLKESEILKALAGTLSPPAPLPEPSSAWLVRVARLLGVQPCDLLSGGYVSPQDLAEQAGACPEQVACLIRASPAWIYSTDH